MATPSKDLISRKSNYKVVYKQTKKIAMVAREKYKISKYGTHSQQGGRTFVPFVLDCYGCLAPAALQLLKDIRDESLSSPLGTPHPFRLTRSSFLTELSRNWQYDNARIVVQWMTLVRAAAKRSPKTLLSASFPLAAAPGSPPPSSSGLAAGVTAADASSLVS